MKKLTKIENLNKAYQAMAQARRWEIYGEKAGRLEAIKKSIKVEIEKLSEFKHPEINNEVCGSPTAFSYLMLARECVSNIRTSKNIKAILSNIEAEITTTYGKEHLGNTGYKAKIEEFNKITNFKG